MNLVLRGKEEAQGERFKDRGGNQFGKDHTRNEPGLLGRRKIGQGDRSTRAGTNSRKTISRGSKQGELKTGGEKRGDIGSQKRSRERTARCLKSETFAFSPKRGRVLHGGEKPMGENVALKGKGKERRKGRGHRAHF